MSNSDYFWLGFIVCYAVASMFVTVLVFLAHTVDLLRERHALKSNLEPPTKAKGQNMEGNI